MGGAEHRNMYYICSAKRLSVRRVVVNTIIYNDELWGPIRPRLVFDFVSSRTFSGAWETEQVLE